MFCPKCGAPTRAVDQRYCQQCGAELNSPYAVSPAALGGMTPGGGLPAPYAGFWRRAGGFIIDDLLVTVALLVVMAITTRAMKGGMNLVIFPLYCVAAWLYYAWMESSALQATVGKLAVGVKVTDEYGRRIGFGRATGRLFAHAVSGIALGIGYAMAVFTRRRQTLHDLIAGTLVVRRDVSPAQIEAAGPAAPVSAWIVVLTVVAFLLFGPFGIGVLAAIAIPAYQDYTIRAQVTEGLIGAAAYKRAVEEAVIEGQALGAISTRTLQLPPMGPLHYVDSIQVESGIVVIQYGRSAQGAIAGRRLLLVPGTTPEKQIVWVCGHHEPPADLTMSVENPGRYTTLQNRYLPMACRGST